MAAGNEGRAVNSPMTIVIAPTHRQGLMYADRSGLRPADCKIVTEPYQIRGVADGTRIIMLGQPSEYRPMGWASFADYLCGRSSALEHDDLDRVSGVVRQDYTEQARMGARLIAARDRNGPTRQQADDTFTAALEGDESAAATVREWASRWNWQTVHPDVRQATMREAMDRIAVALDIPAAVLGDDASFTADMVRSAMSDVRETARRPYIDYRDGPRASHTPCEAPSWVSGPDPVPAWSTPPSVPASGHYDEPDGWGDVPDVSDEPTNDALKAGGADRSYAPLCRGERPVW